jgi:plasmid stabilization system protein ParE
MVWAHLEGPEVAADWGEMVEGTAEKVGEEMAMGRTEVAAMEQEPSVEAVVAGSKVVAASWAVAEVATVAAEEAAGTMAVDAARCRHRAWHSHYRRQHSDPRCSRLARMPRDGRKRAHRMQPPPLPALQGSTRAARATSSGLHTQEVASHPPGSNMCSAAHW